MIQGRGRRITQERITLLYHLKSDPLFRNKTLPLILLLYPLCFEMNFFYEDGRGGIVDDFGNEAAAFVVDPCFRLANLTNLHKYIKNKKVIVENEEPKDTDMQEATIKKERSSTYFTQTRIDYDISFSCMKS